MDGCHRGTFLRVQGITERLATRTLSSWLSFAISVSLQLTGCIVCRIRSGGTSLIGPQRDLTATGTDLNPAQHVLYRPTKWVFTVIQVSHIPAVKGLELRSKQHLSGGLEEFGGWPACLPFRPNSTHSARLYIKIFKFWDYFQYLHIQIFNRMSELRD